MNCPMCKKPMKKIAWQITNNGKGDATFKEYDKTTFNCKTDDSWVTTELPIEK